MHNARPAPFTPLSLAQLLATKRLAHAPFLLDRERFLKNGHGIRGIKSHLFSLIIDDSFQPTPGPFHPAPFMPNAGPAPFTPDSISLIVSLKFLVKSIDASGTDFLPF